MKRRCYEQQKKACKGPEAEDHSTENLDMSECMCKTVIASFS